MPTVCGFGFDRRWGGGGDAPRCSKLCIVYIVITLNTPAAIPMNDEKRAYFESLGKKQLKGKKVVARPASTPGAAHTDPDDVLTSGWLSRAEAVSPSICPATAPVLVDAQDSLSFGGAVVNPPRFMAASSGFSMCGPAQPPPKISTYKLGPLEPLEPLTAPLVGAATLPKPVAVPRDKWAFSLANPSPSAPGARRRRVLVFC